MSEGSNPFGGASNTKKGKGMNDEKPLAPWQKVVIVGFLVAGSWAVVFAVARMILFLLGMT